MSNSYHFWGLATWVSLTIIPEGTEDRVSLDRPPLELVLNTARLNLACYLSTSKPIIAATFKCEPELIGQAHRFGGVPYPITEHAC